MAAVKALGWGCLALVACISVPSGVSASNDEAMLIDGQCRELIAGNETVTPTCRSVMRIDSAEDGTTRVSFSADDMAIEFVGDGRAASIGQISYLMIERVTIRRSGAPDVVTTGEGSCAQSGEAGGPLHVRCVMLNGAVAEFMTDGAPPRRP